MNKIQFLELKLKYQSRRAEDKKAFKELLLQLIFLIAGLTLSLKPHIFWFIGQVILGACLWRSFAILHACGHDGFFRTRWLNTLGGFITSITSYIPYFPWKEVHHAHHRWTGWMDRDPTMKDLLFGRPILLKEKVINFCWKHWIPLLTPAFILKNFFFARNLRSLFSVMLVVTFHATFLILSPLIYIRLFGLSTFIYFTLGDLSLLAQHVSLPMDLSLGDYVKPKPLHEHAAFSRTLLLPDWFEKYVILYFNHHAFHHLFPRMPYYHHPSEGRSVGHVKEWKSFIQEAKRRRGTELLYSHS